MNIRPPTTRKLKKGVQGEVISPLVIMCGIWFLLDASTQSSSSSSSSSSCDSTSWFRAFMKLQARGPDRTDFKVLNDYVNVAMGFHRLAIMDRSTRGDQPFVVETSGRQRTIYALCNGEIYNSKDLVEKHGLRALLTSKSDCEPIAHLYLRYGFSKTVELLRGEFAIVLLDVDHVNYSMRVFAARDFSAVRPLFFGYTDGGSSKAITSFVFSSTLAGVVDDVIAPPENVRQLQRSEVISISVNRNGQIAMESGQLRLLPPHVLAKSPPESAAGAQARVRTTLRDAVKVYMQSDQPLGALLSGGLDSSLVVALASLALRTAKREPLRTFSIGLPGSTDRLFAETVARHCGTRHTHVEFTEDEFVASIPDVVRAIESYDITTVRASVGQYLIAKWVRHNTDIRVLLIGDGADELCSGYLYFHNAPSAAAAHTENVRLLNNIASFDVLRADRCIAYNGIEARAPFLDRVFVSTYLDIEPELRIPRLAVIAGGGRKVEKWLLRSAFDGTNLLPPAVLWRKKEAFSDGVSSQTRSWYQVVQEKISQEQEEEENDKHVVTKEEAEKERQLNYWIKPPTAEARYYRRLFNQFFGYRLAPIVPYYWMPRWCGDETSDPSARTLRIYQGD